MPHPLTELTGSWTGPARTWLGPDPEVSTWRVEIESLLDGRYARLRYDGVCAGKPHHGEMTLGVDDHEHTLYWIDTFHTGASALWSTGPAGPAISVLGSYRAGPERWGWRTAFRRDGDLLVLEATNIHPNGDEDRAIEVRLTRATAAA
ncbi:DUF1579 family protein [Nannocystis radixulma]|uniref:DUF1579 family protein n=1 Tax=Nannocystis radixulma TaxID=2995305 RepID=A0ABT5BJL9_9BACT|nr:DUF1579 family protein [Nannocystis radixulma]MDC0674349.1 DUF1579 family protein [Nannocystis radixulma]